MPTSTAAERISTRPAASLSRRSPPVAFESFSSFATALDFTDQEEGYTPEAEEDEEPVEASALEAEVVEEEVVAPPTVQGGRRACEVYKGTEKKPFAFSHCWPLLEHASKWNSLLTSKKTLPPKKKQKKSSTASPDSPTPGSVDSCCPIDDDGEGNPSADSLKRPGGKKAVKEKQKLGKSILGEDNDSCNEALDAMWSKKKELDVVKEMKKEE
ncbi:hypothetical protein E2562_023439 [Oryza meyeriana var. granulata]|uniref:No apical meristem-associated C-terminal domain-containing protein n=1 Tax=Oryza meyeriana var. granulata TaxID=110450 RepID=A0A6G1FBD3_9ORYZ|nr:hypothetical protein E2562_023439 [Oryza meyeriana var. granulata]